MSGPRAVEYAERPSGTGPRLVLGFLALAGMLLSLLWRLFDEQSTLTRGLPG